MKNYDVVVIGAGPAGYVAAIRCAQLGLTTACVDERVDDKGKASLGGTCLNVGCIPSKALLDTSHHFHDLKHLYPAHGIKVSEFGIDVPAMQARKDKVVQTLTRGVAGLLRKNKVDSYNGRGRLTAGRKVEAANIIIATGSRPVDIPVAPVDGKKIVDSTGALAFPEVPKRLGIIGAGVIGLELGSVWSRLGAQVVLLEALPDFLAPADRDIAKQALREFTRQGLDVRLGSRVTAAKPVKTGVSVKYEDHEGSKALEVDKLVVAVGRRANTTGLDAEAAGLRLDKAGRIEVDPQCRTGVEGIWAVGDVVRGPMLAHKAFEEAVAAAETIAGQAGHCDLSLVPWVIYTHPEIAWVGRTEAELKEQGVVFRAGSFPYAASGRAQGAGETTGLVKMLADAKTDRILGVHIFGAQASELIAEAVTAMAFHASSEDIARIVHAHPTLSETMHEAALATDGRTLHI
jgi:dihydrolipoyl dehydrogenase